jgi:hypothetical protein
MSRFAKILAIAALAFAVTVPAASARVFFYGGYWGPAWYGWYGPGWYGPGPYGYAYAPAPAAGSIKFEHTLKSTSVYVDGGFAGTVGQLGTFKLHSGSHDIELRSADGHTIYQQRVDIVGGKTLKITP